MFTTSQNKGFTLVETVLAMFLGLMVSVAAISLFVSGLEHIQEVRELSYLQSNASFLSNTFNYWIKQAFDLELVDSSTLKIILPESEKIITKNGSDITIDGEPFNDSKVEVLDMSFKKLDSSVQISFALKAEDKTMSLQTTIAKRNNYAY